MKNIIFIITLLCACTMAIAQKFTRTDDFKEGTSKFGFEISGNKSYKVIIDEEYLVFTNKKDKHSVGVKLPVISSQNFKVSYKVIFGSLQRKSDVFGFIFNGILDEDTREMDGDVIYISQEEFYVCDTAGTKIGKPQKIKIKKGSNIEATIDVERKGTKTILTINGMDFSIPALEIKNGYIGFAIKGKNTLKVDEISVTQIVEED